MLLKITSRAGAHVSVAGGVALAPSRAQAEGCEVFQCFTRPPQSGPASKLTPEVITHFKSEMIRCGQADFYIHTPYYLNFASLKPELRAASVRICREELERGSALGAKYVMTHLGSHRNQALTEGLTRVSEAVREILAGYAGTTELLLEISAGSGNIIGDQFTEIGGIVLQVKNIPSFGGVCFDTGHAFASGYDFRTPAGAAAMLKKFDEQIGLRWLKLCHVNDSKVDCGQKRDRHAHIGQGFIGEAGLRALLTTSPFARIDWILETETDQRPADLAVLKKIRALD